MRPMRFVACFVLLFMWSASLGGSATPATRIVSRRRRCSIRVGTTGRSIRRFYALPVGRCQALRSEPGPLVPFDVNDGRIVASGDNATVILDPEGRELPGPLWIAGGTGRSRWAAARPRLYPARTRPQVGLDDDRRNPAPRVAPERGTAERTCGDLTDRARLSPSPRSPHPSCISTLELIPSEEGCHPSHE